tara:strand:+ start:393 stop:533 length:141 start_codon:yes stop_codon:yes gene_type:complete
MNALEATQPSPFQLTILCNLRAEAERYINMFKIRKNTDFFLIEYLS